jgi:hypothetical protein
MNNVTCQASAERQIGFAALPEFDVRIATGTLVFRVSGNQHTRASAATAPQTASDDVQPPARLSASGTASPVATAPVRLITIT